MDSSTSSNILTKSSRSNRRQSSLCSNNVYDSPTDKLRQTGFTLIQNDYLQCDENISDNDGDVVTNTETIKTSAINMPSSTFLNSSVNKRSSLPETDSLRSLSQLCQNIHLSTSPSFRSGTSAPLSELSPDTVNLLTPRLRNLNIRDSISSTSPLAQENLLPDDLKQTDNTSNCKTSGRLVIRHLVLTNFKSYSGRQIIGPFHPSFSSIVGPNGSGKSNVIDALLFVFGFRASKMRHSKVSALIHKSDSHLNFDFCEVEVRFEEVNDIAAGQYQVCENSQLRIARRAFKNNSSKYFINEQPSDYTTVTSLLRTRGVDLDHKRFLILQGEVESIAQMKPKAPNEHEDGLLEYLEDIIGSSKYKKPIEDAISQLDNLRDICTERKNRVDIVTKQREGLEDKRAKVIKFITDEKELAIRRTAYLSICRKECCDIEDIEVERVGKLEDELEAEIKRNREKIELLKQAEVNYESAKDRMKNLSQAHAKQRERTRKLEKEGVKVDEKIKFLQTKSKKLEKELEKAMFRKREAESSLAVSERQIQQNTSELTERERDIGGQVKLLEDICDGLKGKTGDLSRAVEEKQRSLEPWQKKIMEKRSALELAKSELEILQEREGKAQADLDKTEKRRIALVEQLNLTKQQIEDCQNKIKLRIEQKQAIQAELDCVNREKSNFRTELSTARQLRDEAKASLSSNRCDSTVLSALTRLSETGRLEGFYGRLGDLGTIDGQYDVAISTASGGGMNSMVVDNVEIGQRCIEYLRQNNVGRGNFIVLDRLANRDLGRIETPEGAKRLFDLVKSEEKFLPAFYSVIQNTLVAKDLEQANRIAYNGTQRWRVVTLEGELIDKSGTMSGGGTRVMRGAMGRGQGGMGKVSEERVQGLEFECKEKENLVRDNEKKINELEDKFRIVEGEFEIGQREMQKLKIEMECIKRNIDDCVAQQNEIKRDTVVDEGSKYERRRQQVEEKVNVLEMEIGKVRGSMMGLENDISELQEKIMETGGVKLRVQKAKVDGMKEEINGLRETINRARINLKMAKVELTKWEKSFGEIKEEKESLDEELIGINSECKGIYDELKEENNRLEGKEEELEECRNEVEELKKRVESSTEELKGHQTKQVGLKNVIEEGENRLRDIRQEKGRIEVNMQKVRRKVEERQKECQNMISVDNYGDDTELHWWELPEYTYDEIEGMDKKKIAQEIHGMEEAIEKCEVDFTALQEYSERLAEEKCRQQDLEESINKRDEIDHRLEDLRNARLESFMRGLERISWLVKRMYKLLTMGGSAELELVDSLDPFSEGVVFSVMPPRKSWKNIQNLSGGEKTISSLALVFALHEYKPTPLYVMDEIDAALDFRNVSIIGNYIRERTRNAQFIVISLRNNMFELASRLVGVYKVQQRTRTVTLENSEVSPVSS